MGRDSCEPIVEDNMKLWSDVARGGVQDNWDSACVFVGQSHVHAANGTWLPSWELLSVRQTFVQDVDGASPNLRRSCCWRRSEHAGGCGASGRMRCWKATSVGVWILGHRVAFN